MTTTVAERLLSRLGHSNLSQLKTLGLLAHLDNHMTPAESAELREWIQKRNYHLFYRFVPGNSPYSRLMRRVVARHSFSQNPLNSDHVLINWANLQESVLHKAGISHQGRTWTRRWRRGGLEFFTGNSVSAQHLVICVAGLMPRMMMPLPVFLASLGDLPVDVLKIEQPDRLGYQTGITGFASDFDEILVNLEAFVAEGKYHTVSVIGASSGGLPAVLIGRALDAEMLWVAGPLSQVGPYSAYLEFSQKMKRAPLRQGKGTQGPDSHLIIYGDADNKDVAAAEELSREWPVFGVYPVAGEGHNSLYPLAKTGELSTMLRHQLSRHFA